MAEHGLHDSESGAPFGESVLDGLPLLVHDVTLDDDHFLDLVDLGVDDACGYGFNRPLLHFILLYIESLCEIIVLMVRTVEIERANLHILLLLDDIFHRQLLLVHQHLETLHLSLELFRVSGGE